MRLEEERINCLVYFVRNDVNMIGLRSLPIKQSTILVEQQKLKKLSAIMRGINGLIILTILIVALFIITTSLMIYLVNVFRLLNNSLMMRI